MANEFLQVPPKPNGEPSIDLLPAIQTGWIVEDSARNFSFEATSGYSSFRVTYTSDLLTDQGTFSSLLEAATDGASIRIRSAEGDNVVEVVLLEDGRSWIERSGEWAQDPGEGEFVLGVVVAFIMPDATHGVLYDSFDSLVFRDWDLIDSVWYARYDLSPLFVSALLDNGLPAQDLPAFEGAVWVSPLGFMHSYELDIQDGETGDRLQTSWRLSDLGSTTVESPSNTTSAPQSSTPSDN